MVPDWLEFIVHDDGSDVKSRSCVYINDLLEEVTKFGCGGACSIVIRFILRDTKTRNGMEFTNITSSTRVTLWLKESMSAGIST
jgi:hypothetical protein